MAHAARRPSKFGPFLLGVLFSLAALAAAILWAGQHTARVAELRPAVTIPMPRIPPPPGVVPRAAAPATPG